MKHFNFLFVFIFILFISCSKDDDKTSDLVAERCPVLICIECSATFNGQTTVPAQFCGTEKETDLFEQRYRDINKPIPQVIINCIRK
ncbi:hypothetical protein [Dysgonomonas sp. ZJ709]|uniref:hypothetical protein n=1 Tax=Dysgonomonas sp. ZJ709 TaxID=2709797 RepID=UPI0013EB2302|nr:hypothetical protein [Dysgonomonas sp. ZJ709]